ncbi:hypothetical protein QQY66_36845 [Streptomyces sp. DG2A-72]|uniref:hypothetical protein n=1 Tax=Streptomyces sp. DG2A-72 TaxID=3051386 RepID=UPI00265C1BB4|nr:hypothetical protein [Streptomyces sp. DG2A-72]MDO0937017.1 hypothetical protein [Streptomyces sp. DG2A-72]
MTDLEVDPEILKKGASGILECLTPVEKVDLEPLAKQGSSIGVDSATAALVTFCATWQSGVEFLADCAATLAEGLNSASNNYAATDEAIHDAVNSVKSDLS